MDRYLEARGQISLDDLAAAAGVTKKRISKWKSEDRWNDKLNNLPKHKGGQPGNNNAAGRTPKKDGNKNAETHGAYSKIDVDSLSSDKMKEIQSLRSENTQEKMLNNLQSLLIRRVYLTGLLERYTSSDNEGKFYDNNIVRMSIPSSKKIEATIDGKVSIEQNSTTRTKSNGKTLYETISSSSAFERAMRVEAELNRLHGRITKQLDSIKAYELERRRLELEEKKFEIQKQKIAGIYNFDEETGNLIEDNANGDDDLQ